MLRFLRIARLAVIDAAEVEFEPGLNILTGETGAGKSILVGAVGLLLGGRASGDLVRTGEDTAVVEAIFDGGPEQPDGIVVRREITAHGRSRAYVNGDLVTAAALKALAGDLIELHGQHEHQTLLDPATHLAALDAYGRPIEALERTASAYTDWRETAAEVEALRAAARDRTNRLDLAAFQLAEIDRVAPRAGEDEELTATRTVLANAARIEQLCNESYAALYDQDQSVLVGLGAVWKRVGELAALDPVFAPHMAARDSIKAQLEDLAASLRGYTDRLDVSGRQLEEVEDRLAALERVKRKYGPTLTDVLHQRGKLAEEVQRLTHVEGRLEARERELAARRSAFERAAAALSLERRAIAERFRPALLDLLAGLALERAAFAVRFDENPLPEDEWTAAGTDRVEFDVSLNPGEELRPLARIVSGGELSRVMLALKTLIFRTRLAATEATAAVRPLGSAAPGMIFDEIDAGIGGRVAEVVGHRLRGLGAGFQVLCITHLPQVAAHADAHFLIEKQVLEGRTHTSITRLSEEQRAAEIARMLAGATITPSVLASAREMLSAATDRRAKGESKSKGESESAAPQQRRKERRGPQVPH